MSKEKPGEIGGHGGLMHNQGKRGARFEGILGGGTPTEQGVVGLSVMWGKDP